MFDFCFNILQATHSMVCETDFHSKLSVIGLRLKVKDVFPGSARGLPNVLLASNRNFVIG